MAKRVLPHSLEAIGQKPFETMKLHNISDPADHRPECAAKEAEANPGWIF